MTRALAATFLAGITLCQVAWAGVIYTDTEFSAANYAVTSYSSGSVASTVGQVANGNPGNAFRTSWSANGSYEILVGAIRNSFAFDPLVSGAIASIDYAIDRIGTRTVNGVASPFSTYTLRPLIFQNGNYYQAISAPVSGVDGLGNNVWVTLQLNGLKAMDFGLYNFATGTLNAAINPNFGASMTFGFVSAVGSGASGATVAETRNDNWIVKVNTVPEPGAIALLGLALAGLAVACRRRAGFHL